MQLKNTKDVKTSFGIKVLALVLQFYPSTLKLIHVLGVTPADDPGPEAQLLATSKISAAADASWWRWQIYVARCYRDAEKGRERSS